MIAPDAFRIKLLSRIKSGVGGSIPLEEISDRERKYIPGMQKQGWIYPTQSTDKTWWNLTTEGRRALSLFRKMYGIY